MWLATRLGFYSTVAWTKGRIAIRGRRRNDLQNLKEAVRRFDGRIRFDVISTPKSDYPFRAIVTATAFRRICQMLAETVDYPNFKSMIDKTPDQREKHQAYQNLWWNLVDLTRGAVGRDNPRNVLRTGKPVWEDLHLPFRRTIEIEEELARAVHPIDCDCQRCRPPAGETE